MRKLGVLANPRKDRVEPVLQLLAKKAGQCGMTLVTCDQTAELVPGAEKVDVDNFSGSIDALMALGGDGTMLRAVRLLGRSDKPVLGVNLGSLGFLTSITEDDLDSAIDALLKDDYLVSNRTMVSCRVSRDSQGRDFCTALNDIVIGWGTVSRAITLDLEIDGESVASYLCDGLIVSTPTGSTGHSLSAWGPIVHPESPVLLVNVICPHTLSGRPLVLTDKSRIGVSITDIPADKKLLLSADGQEELPLEAGDRVEITKLAEPVRIINLKGYSYFSVLRQKLNWHGSHK